MNNTPCQAQEIQAIAGGFDAVQAWNHEAVIARIARKCDLSREEAAKAFGDVKSFLWRSRHSAEALKPTPAVDAAWHEFLMFTRPYREFCLDVLGGFVDHCPEESGAKRAGVADCVSCFGQSHPDDDDCSSKVNLGVLIA